MNRLVRAACGMVLIGMISGIAGCAKKGTTDVDKLVRIVASQEAKGYLDNFHNVHQKSGMVCDKFKNPDRIKICANCHRGNELKIAKELCQKCHLEK